MAIILTKKYSRADVTNIDAFLDLTDVPTTYNGQANKYLVVNNTEDGIVFDSVEFAGNLEGGAAFSVYGGTLGIDGGAAFSVYGGTVSINGGAAN